MIHDYPYTDFHELNLDYIMRLARKSMGLHLETSDKFLVLKNAAGDVISKLQVTYAETALQDDEGHEISTYLLSAGTDASHLILTRGNDEIVTLTIPFATKAETDINGTEIVKYVKGVGISGNKLKVTFGDGDTYEFTVPFANKAKADSEGKELTTYVASITMENDKLVVRDGLDRTLAEVTVSYAVKSKNDFDSDDIRETYGTTLTTGSNKVQLRNKLGEQISEITVPYSVTSLSDINNNEFLVDYGYHLAVDGTKVAIESHSGKTLNEITVPFAVLATDATNAIEQVSISGNNVIFTTYGGREIVTTVPYALKATSDGLGNEISETYVANVTNDPSTGTITFFDAEGNVISSLVPTIDAAVHDNLGNVLSSFVKQITVDNQSNYVSVLHGDGTTESLIIHYSETAWKDTYDNVIGNTYIRRLSIEEDFQTGHFVLVAYNGELSELFRIELKAYMAQVDINERDLTSYVGDVVVNASENLDVLDGENSVKREISASTRITDTVPTSITFDDTTETLNIVSGTRSQITVPTNFEEVT